MEEKTELQKEVQQLLSTLEQKRICNSRQVCLYNGFWCPNYILYGVLSAKKNFKARETDTILATLPKSGTVWLKALTFSIVNRHCFSVDDTPLLTTNPHELIRFLEFNIFRESENPNLDDFNICHPRIFSTHMPYHSLPKSILEAKCKIIYICRNPLDQFISGCQFLLANPIQSNNELANPIQSNGDPSPIDQAFDMFCEGIFLFGPFWDHVLGYWNESLKQPDRVLFLKYEELKEDTGFHVKKVADFMGFPFSEDEEKKGLIDEIVKLCGFENLKSLEENQPWRKNSVKSGKYMINGVFRKGEVGDWQNYLTPSMAQRFQNIMDDKLSGSGLTFKCV